MGAFTITRGLNSLGRVHSGDVGAVHTVLVFPIKEHALAIAHCVPKNLAGVDFHARKHAVKASYSMGSVNDSDEDFDVYRVSYTRLL